MPRGRPPIPNGVRDVVLARIARGERLKHICRDPGMPHQTAVSQWVREDPWFAQRYREAQAKGEQLRTCRFEAQKAAEILRRLHDGEPLQRVLVGLDMPSRATFRIWRLNEPAFAEALFELARSRRELAALRRRGKAAPFDQAVADRILVRVGRGAALRQLRRLDPALPGFRTVQRWRREQPRFARELRLALKVANGHRQRRRLCNDAVIEAVTDRVFEGETLNAIARDPAMPCATTLYAWLRQRPDFYRAMEAALQARAQMLADQVLDLAEARTPGRSRASDRLKAKVRRLDERAGKVGPRE